jgi:hypothetical protein
MSGRDPIASLRRLAPVSDAQAAEVFGVAGREELLDGVTSLSVDRETRPRPAWRRRPLVLGIAVVAAAGTAAAAWAILGSSARETTSVECVIRGVDSVIPSSSGDPAQDCAIEWKREVGGAAPPLRAYDNGVGGVTVLPRSVTPPAGYKRLASGQDVDLIQLQSSLDDYIDGLNSSCLDRSAATTLARSKLAQFGFTRWTIAVRSPGSSSTNAPTPKVKPGGPQAAPGESTSGARTCVASDIVDPATQTVTLIPTEVQTGGPQEAMFLALADKLRPIGHGCDSLPDAVASATTAADGMGLSQAAKTYELNTVVDNSMRCASIYETVGGTIFLTVRGPRG